MGKTSRPRILREARHGPPQPPGSAIEWFEKIRRVESSDGGIGLWSSETCRQELIDGTLSMTNCLMRRLERRYQETKMNLIDYSDGV